MLLHKADLLCAEVFRLARLHKEEDRSHLILDPQIEEEARARKASVGTRVKVQTTVPPHREKVARRRGGVG
jgi:hypothetical protein